ncbi:glycosyltransferase [Schleiferiaceae bacterium]|nr:glycosyltransferase [Schleiferiaceae bacterium]
MNINLSVVVPTRNRHYYLRFLVEYFYSIDSESIELIIYDNSDQASRLEFISFLDEIGDLRIKYFSDDGELSQTDNCDRAVSKACGEYIMMLGDDDIFSKHVLDLIVDWSSNEVDVILPVKGVYYWPDIKSRLYGEKNSGMYHTESFTNTVERIDAKGILDCLVDKGGTDILRLPRLYHGIVKKDLLDKIKASVGTYFPGPSPDIANAIALAVYAKHYIILDLPLVISGQSKLSAGGKGAAGEHYGEIASIRQLPKDSAKIWSEKVPFYWSGKTIYAESTLKALNKLRMYELMKRFNYTYLYACCFVFDFRYRGRIMHCVRNSLTTFQRSRVIGFFILIWIQRVLHHIKYIYLRFMQNGGNRNRSIIYIDNTYDVALANDRIIDEFLGK